MNVSGYDGSIEPNLKRDVSAFGEACSNGEYGQCFQGQYKCARVVDQLPSTELTRMYWSALRRFLGRMAVTAATFSVIAWGAP